MTATGFIKGEKFYYIKGKWVNKAGKGIPKDSAPCKTCGKEPKLLRLKIDKSMSHTGKSFWKLCPVDYCIADIVEALQKGGINMLSSCCGHKKEEGFILLADGRTIKIMGN
jgi:hypothetical protein